MAHLKVEDLKPPVEKKPTRKKSFDGKEYTEEQIKLWFERIYEKMSFKKVACLNIFVLLLLSVWFVNDAKFFHDFFGMPFEHRIFITLYGLAVGILCIEWIRLINDDKKRLKNLFFSDDRCPKILDDLGKEKPKVARKIRKIVFKI